MAFDVSPVTFGTVTGLFGGAGQDGADADLNPDGFVATGSFLFTPNVKYLISTTPSKRIDILPIVATIDANGYLSNNGTTGVTLVATDGTLAAAANLQYTVTSPNYAVNSVAQPFTPVTILVPSSGVDLVQAVPVLAASLVAPVGAAINDSATTANTVWSSSKTAATIAAIPGGGGGSGAAIDDTTTSTTKTWSSSKTNTSISAEATRAATAEGLAAQKAANLSDLANAGTARTNLGLGSAATQASSAFDAAGAAAAVTATTLGLGNVNNTSDANKPVSTAQAAVNAVKPNAVSARSVVTTTTTAVAATKYAADATTAAFTITLPATSATTDQIVIQKTDASVNIVTIAGKIDGTAASSLPLRTQLQGKLLQGDGTGGWNIIGSDLSLPALDLRFQALGARAPLIVTIPFATTMTPNASLANVQRITATANHTINAPTNPTEGQTLALEITSSAGAYQTTLQTGVSQGFAFGSTVTSIPLGITNKMQRIYATYRSASSRWEIIDVLEGF